jgi:hypothetical protein
MRPDIVSAGVERIVSSHIGTPINTDRTFREYREPVDTLLVAGGIGAQELRYERDFLNWLVERSVNCRRFGSICTGEAEAFKRRAASRGTSGRMDRWAFLGSHVIASKSIPPRGRCWFFPESRPRFGGCPLN